MIFVNIKKEGNLDRALKKLKWKFDKTGVVKELRKRQSFIKKSDEKREKMRKAVYKESLKPK